MLLRSERSEYLPFRVERSGKTGTRSTSVSFVSRGRRRRALNEVAGCAGRRAVSAYDPQLKRDGPAPGACVVIFTRRCWTRSSHAAISAAWAHPRASSTSASKHASCRSAVWRSVCAGARRRGQAAVEVRIELGVGVRGGTSRRRSGGLRRAAEVGDPTDQRVGKRGAQEREQRHECPRPHGEEERSDGEVGLSSKVCSENGPPTDDSATRRPERISTAGEHLDVAALVRPR